MSNNTIQKHIARIEAIEGRAIAIALHELYTVQFYTIRKLAKKWDIKNNRAISTLLHDFNIPIRYGSEAIQSQWINADERKRQTSQNVRSYVTRSPHPNLGKTKETCPNLFRQSERQKISTSFKNPAVMAAISAIRKRNHLINPGLHVNAHARPTRRESLVIDHLTNSGYQCIHNFSYPPYWLDIFIPALNMAVECFHTSRLPFNYARHAEISAKGITIIYISNNTIDKSSFFLLDKYIAGINAARLLPSFNSQDTVIIGVGRATPFYNYPAQSTDERVNVNKINMAFFSTSANNCLSSL